MTITVTAPNGATIQFPDGTDHGTINGVMTQHFGGAAPADPVTANDAGRSFASGVPIIGGLLDKADAATNAALAPVLNPLFDPKDQLSEPTFRERYAHSLRDQQGMDAKFEDQHPVVDAGLKLAGGAAAMVPAIAAAPAALGVTGSLGARVLNGGISNAALGGADSLVRGENPVTGAIVGGVGGAVLGPALEGLAHVATNNPIVSNISARLNPERFAQGQVARAISESGQTPQQIGRQVTDAAADGQSEFTVGDAMGNAGQRMLSTVARAPGDGRTAVVDALEGRQGTQGRRISNALSEGFDSPRTAAQTEAGLTAARDTAADAEYGAVRTDAAPVDMSGTIDHIDQILGTKPGEVVPQKPLWTPPEPKAAAPDVQAAPAAGAPKTQSLLEFLASKGGLGPDQELNAIGAHGHTVNVDGLGRRKLVRQGGWPLDYAREAAEEAGYLRGDHNGTSTVNDLLDAVDAEMRGQKRYPEGFEGHQTKRETAAMGEREQGQYDAHINGLENDLADAGHGQIGPDVKARAIHLMSRQGMDADSAVEHAFSQLEQEDAAHAAAKSSGFPGDKVWEAPPVVGAPVVPPPNDSAEGVLHGFRQRLARVNPEDFSAVQRIRGEMADAAQNARQNGYGNRARLIGGAVRRLDAAMENASAGHLAANRNFSQASRNIEAVDAGRAAATRGRTEDTIPAFQALPAEGQRAFRSGYVDPLIAQTQGAAVGANKARPLLNDAFRAEADAMAPGNALMQRRLAREQTMFETRAQALGGSKTADNLHDHAAMAIDPHLVGAVGHILHGNIGGAAASVGRLMANGWTGNTPEVRQQVARILLQRAPGMNRGALENMVNQTVARLQRAQAITRQISRGATGALVTQGNQR